jgi:hypothetical protein
VTRAGSPRAGFVDLVLGSVTGTSPGVDLLGVNLPLEYDAYFQARLVHPGAGPLNIPLGLLDGSGSAGPSSACPRA